MPSRQHAPRSFDQYESLKKKILKKINNHNAQATFESAKKRFLRQLKNLNTGDITAVENLYLSLITINHALALLWANEKAKKDGISIEDALDKFGTEQMVVLLKQHLETATTPSALITIQKVDERFKPAKDSWAAGHAKLLAVLTQLKQPTLDLIAFIDKRIKFLQKQADKFRAANNLEAATAAELLIMKINASMKQYLVDNDKNAFQISLGVAIIDTSPDLKKQHGWQKIVNDFINAIISMFSSSSTKTPTFSFFNQPLTKNLTELTVVATDADFNPPKP